MRYHLLFPPLTPQPPGEPRVGYAKWSSTGIPTKPLFAAARGAGRTLVGEHSLSATSYQLSSINIRGCPPASATPPRTPRGSLMGFQLWLTLPLTPVQPPPIGAEGGSPLIAGPWRGRTLSAISYTRKLCESLHCQLCQSNLGLSRPSRNRVCYSTASAALLLLHGGPRLDATAPTPRPPAAERTSPTSCPSVTP